MKNERYGIIYKITNTINDKVYIGQTTNTFNRRYRAGKWWKYTTNRHLISSVNMYGHEVFEVDKEFDVAMTKEELDIKEKLWIEYYQSNNANYGYNIEDGGANGKLNGEAKEWRIEFNRNLAKNKKGVPRTPEERQAIQDAWDKIFLEEHTQEEADLIQKLFNEGYSKSAIEREYGYSIWIINRFIKLYNLSFTPKPPMLGKKGELNPKYNKPRDIEANDKIVETWNKKRADKWLSELDNIQELLDNGVSISEISVRYNTSRATIRKVIKQFGLTSYGLNVKKFDRNGKVL